MYNSERASLVNGSGLVRLTSFFSAVKMLHPMAVNRVTDVDICFQIYHILYECFNMFSLV